MRTKPRGARLNRRVSVGLAALSLLCWFVSGPLAEDGKSPDSKSVAKNAAKAALTQFQDLIGEWRGVGQPKRNSAAGAWGERAEWRWKFEGGDPSLEYSVAEGKLLKSAVLSFDPGKKTFRLLATELGDSADSVVERTYKGTVVDKKLVLESPPKDQSEGRRITITRLNEKRTLVLFERQGAGQSFFTRIAEVGYTREGTRLAESDQTGPVCVVTGGVGTIKVTHKGQTYWVCCTGCRDAFNDDPAGILAEYQKKLDEKSKK